MPKRSTRSDCSLRLLWLFLFFAFFSRSLSAEWYKDYEEGLIQIKKGNWSSAVPKLRSAISEKDEEGSNIKFYGLKFGDYFPHFYLGMAYYYTGEVLSAQKEFERSEYYGQIKRKKDLYQKMSELRSLAAAQLASHQMAKSPSHAIPTAPVVPSPLPSVEPKENQPKEARQEKEVNTSQQIPEKKEVPPTKIEDKRIEPKPLKESPRKNQQTPEPHSLESLPRPIAKPPTPNVNDDESKTITKNGARRYFEGKYDEAVQLLLTAIRKNPRYASAQFLLGCSYASKYLLSGSQDSALVQKAALAFRKCKQIDPAYQAKGSPYISPAVMEIYQKSS